MPRLRQNGHESVNDKLHLPTFAARRAKAGLDYRLALRCCLGRFALDVRARGRRLNAGAMPR